MTVYNERCTIVANPNGSIKTVFVDQMGIDDAGRHYSIGQATIGDEALTQFLGNSHNVALAGITKLTADLEAKTTECDKTKAALDKLTEDMVNLVAAHKAELDAKEAALTTANATIAALESRVASLLAELPFNPKIIDATAFYNRITKEEFAELLTSDDANKVNIGNTIMAYVKNDWPIVFESPEFQGMIGYLLSVGFPAARAAQLTADASRAEAYDAD